VLVLEDGRLGLVDVGMVLRLPDSVRKDLLRLLVAISEGHGEDAARVVIAMSEQLEGFDDRRFVADVADVVERNYRSPIGAMDAGTVVMELTRTAATTGLRPPATMAVVGKTLLEVDQVARGLDPDFRPADAVQSRTGQLIETGMSPSAGRLLGAAMEAKDFAEQLPSRVNRVMDALASGRFELRVRAIDENELLTGLHRMANRLATGLVLASLIIGASMMLRVHSSWQVLGYPGLAIVVFGLAALGGVALLVSIVVSDRGLRRRKAGVPVPPHRR
jgi:ubiquinone biosynthesis protein